MRRPPRSFFRFRKEKQVQVKVSFPLFSTSSPFISLARFSCSLLRRLLCLRACGHLACSVGVRCAAARAPVRGAAPGAEGPRHPNARPHAQGPARSVCDAFACMFVSLSCPRIVPCLPQCLVRRIIHTSARTHHAYACTHAGDHRSPTWIKWTKKILVEDGHVIAQQIHIWTLVTRHPHLFYASRGQFVPQARHLTLHHCMHRGAQHPCASLNSLCLASHLIVI
jgi:hypothetical protein